MDMDALKPILAGIVRHALTSFGGMLVASGYMQSSDTAALVGGGMVVAGMLWSWWQKEGQAKLLAIVAKMHPVVSPNATTSQAVKAATDAAKAVASILLIAFVLSAFLAVPSAQAQVRRPLAVTGDPIKDIKTDLNNAGIKVPTTKAGATCDFNIFAALNPQNVVTDVQNCVSDVNKLFLPDVQAALDSATAYSDKPAIDCLTPALAIVKAAVGTPAVIAPDGTVTTPAVQAGIILIFQKFREFTLANGPSACKNWVQSTINGTVSNAL